MHSAKRFPMDFFDSNRRKNVKSIESEVPRDNKDSTSNDWRYVHPKSNSRNRALKPIINKKSENLVTLNLNCIKFIKVPQSGHQSGHQSPTMGLSSGKFKDLKLSKKRFITNQDTISVSHWTLKEPKYEYK
jgi:hypothetical protein